MWLALISFHLIGLVGFNLLLRRSVLDKVDKLTLATVLQTGITIPAIVIFAIHPPDFNVFSKTDYLLIACATLLTIGLQLVNVKALQYLEAGVYSVLYNLRIIIATCLGVLFLNENVILLRIIGGICIFLAIIIIKQRSSRKVRLQGIGWGVAAATVLSFLNLTEKLLIQGVGFINYFPLVSILAAIIMWTCLRLVIRDIHPRILYKPKMMQLMALRALSAYGFSGALAAGALLSVANYISGMSVILTVLLGAMWLRERDYLIRKALATAVAVIGLTLILISGL